MTVLALGLAAFALGLVVLLARRLGRLERAFAAQVGGGGPGRSSGPADAEDVRADDVRAELARARADLASALRHVAVVRYDAFGDVGGRLSFSAALLDDAGNGMVLSSIAGRADSRTYAKGVTGGGSEHALSPEELEAIGRARSGSPVHG